MSTTRQDLFDELDRYFISDAPGTPPQPVQLLLEWAAQTDLSAHHINAVGAAAKQIIAAMANNHDKVVTRGSKLRLIDTLCDIYNLRDDLYKELDRWYRKWWDRLMDKVDRR